MKIFVADIDDKVRSICREYGMGILSSPSYFRPPSDLDYILDNGAFGAWKNGDEWDDKLFYKIVDRLCLDGINPYFVVIPDIVCGGLKSLEHSQKHIGNLPMQWNKYLPVQDGMCPGDIDIGGDQIDGIFVGGSVDWKWRTAKDWCSYAHKNGIKCHIGRVGTIRDYTKAESCGADSVDGSGPSRNNRMDIPIKFLKIISKEQTRLF